MLDVSPLIETTYALHTPVPAEPTVASYSFVLAIMFFLVMALSAVSLSRVVYLKHRLKSISTAFLIMCFLWSAMRAACFLFLEFIQARNILVFVLIYRMPFLFQLATFGLLVLFYASVVHRAEWATHWRGVYVAMYSALLGLFVVGMGVIYGLLVYNFSLTEQGDAPAADTLGTLLVVDSIIRMCMDLLLTGLISAYGLKVFFNWRDSQVVLGRHSSKWKLFTLLLLLVVVFVSRFIVTTLTVAKVIDLQVRPGFTKKSLITMLLIVVWEIIPIIVFVLYFWPRGLRYVSAYATSRVPTYSFEDLDSPDRASLRTISSQSFAIPAQGGSNVFQHHSRYDSSEDDDEDDLGPNSTYSPYATSTSTSSINSAGRSSGSLIPKPVFRGEF